MKNFLSIAILSLVLPLSLNAQSAPQVPQVVNDQVTQFDQKLRNTYGQSDSNTPTRHLIYGSLEAITAYKLGSFISKKDRRAIQSVSKQIRDIQFPEFDGNVSSQYAAKLTDVERKEKLKLLKKQLRRLEGNIVTKSGRGMTKILLRGTQVFLILDLGTRVYVLSNLQGEDPGMLPFGTLLCSEVDCETAINQITYTSTQAYNAARYNTP